MLWQQQTGERELAGGEGAHEARNQVAQLTKVEINQGGGEKNQN